MNKWWSESPQWWWTNHADGPAVDFISGARPPRRRGCRLRRPVAAKVHPGAVTFLVKLLTTTCLFIILLFLFLHFVSYRKFRKWQQSTSGTPSFSRFQVQVTRGAIRRRGFPRIWLEQKEIKKEITCFGGRMPWLVGQRLHRSGKGLTWLFALKTLGADRTLISENTIVMTRRKLNLTQGQVASFHLHNSSPSTAGCCDNEWHHCSCWYFPFSEFRKAGFRIYDEVNLFSLFYSFRSSFTWFRFISKSLFDYYAFGQPFILLAGRKNWIFDNSWRASTTTKEKERGEQKNNFSEWRKFSELMFLLIFFLVEKYLYCSKCFGFLLGSPRSHGFSCLNLRLKVSESFFCRSMSPFSNDRISSDCFFSKYTGKRK